MDRRFILIFTILLSSTCVLDAQDIKLTTNSIQVASGLANTSPWRPPVSFGTCANCIIEEQNPRTVFNFEMSYFRKYKKAISTKFGLGTSSYRFRELGNDQSNPSPIHFEEIRHFKYYNVLLGQLRTFSSNEKFTPFTENEIIVDILREENDFLKPVALAARLNGGIIFGINEFLHFKVNGFAQTGLMNYKKDKEGNAFVPRSFGFRLAFYLQLV